MNTLGQGWWLGAQSLPAPRLLSLGVVLGAVCLSYTLLERSAHLPDALRHSLSNASLGLGLPLFSYLAVDRSLSAGNLERSLAALARHGSNRRQLTLGLWARASTWSAAFAAATSLSSLWLFNVARSSELGEALNPWYVAGVSALGASGYCSLWVALSLIGGGHRARLAGLLADWILGASVGLLALPWPRRHIADLMGMTGAFEGPPWAGALALAALTVLGVAVAVGRTPP